MKSEDEQFQDWLDSIGEASQLLDGKAQTMASVTFPGAQEDVAGPEVAAFPDDAPVDPEEAAAALAAERAAKIAWMADQHVIALEARDLAKLLHRQAKAKQNTGSGLRLVNGWEFLKEDEQDTTPIWGSGNAWAWAPGESLMIFGPNGVFKSTLAQLLVFARLGLIDPVVLGYPVQPLREGKILYLAGDRPRQIKRAMRRHRRSADQEALATRLIVHVGPLPFDITTDKDALADLCEQHGVEMVVVDSIKDFCPKPSEDESGVGYNTARQECIARGIEWLELHHNRKQQQGQGKTNKLDDVYGSRWLTAGAGSVLSLWTDNEGSSVVHLAHLKVNSGDPLPELTVTVDKTKGTMAALTTIGLVEFVRGFGTHGATVSDVAGHLGKGVEATRRQLKSRVEQGVLEENPVKLADNLQRFRVVLGVVPQQLSTHYQQDGLPGVD